jgi:hypothetical protein
MNYRIISRVIALAVSASLMACVADGALELDREEHELAAEPDAPIGAMQQHEQSQDAASAKAPFEPQLICPPGTKLDPHTNVCVVEPDPANPDRPNA